ncbi:MAG: alpha-L-fucosidase [Bacteroidetes bacterium]|nr:alpha-L-fucosidase [Bacteroidota bacterium]
MRKINLWIILFLITGIFSCKNTKISAPAPVYPVPTQQQLDWHKLETYAFIHFTTNTFTGKEWGYGDESPAIFNPSELNAEQWVKTIKDAGLKAVILTCKHHDGFVLWPSKYTPHSVAASPYKNGKGDIVKEVSEACKKYGLKFGIYLSPWDRNRGDYGTPSYVDYYRMQLRELFENYGPVFEMWFDGANGGDGFYGGKNEKRKIDGKTFYDWPKTIELVRGLEPNILFFSDAGPDIRWVGNERGIAGSTNWNNISRDTLYAGKSGIENLLNTGNESGVNWVPAEVDVSIRPGWFYHKEEDDKVKTPEQLFDIYLTSVGRGSNLLLNIPPDRRGLIHENDVKALLGWRKLLNERFSKNLAQNALAITNSNFSKKLTSGNLTDGNHESYWAAKKGSQSADITIKLSGKYLVSYVEIQENIALGQRVKAFEVTFFENNQWVKKAEGTTIGYKRILKITPTETDKIRITIKDSKAEPVLSEVKVW